MKIAICVPAYGDVKAEFTDSLVRLVIATLEAEFVVDGAKVRPQINPFLFSASLVQVARINLAQLALKWGADFILWADSDQTFPPKSLTRLLAHNVDVVGVNCPRRTPPHELTATGLDGKPLQSGAGLEAVKSMGMPLCLVRASVFQGLPQPWFQVTIGTNGLITGEDCHFFGLLRAAGVEIHVDHDLSAEIGHIGQRIYTAENVRRDRGG